MLLTLCLTAVMLLVLTAVGWVVLSLVPREVRDELLPAAPALGAATLAAVSSTASRYLAAPGVLVVVGVLLIGVLLVGSRGSLRSHLDRRRAVAGGLDARSSPGLVAARPPEGLRGRWAVRRTSVVDLALAPVLALGGAAVVLLPTWWAGDHRPVAPTIIVDQFYFSATSEHLQRDPMLPMPPWQTGDWVGSAQPSYGPVVDVIVNRLRYGQAAVAAMLSTLFRSDASDTVVAVTLLWLLVLAGAVVACLRLLGVGRVWALAGAGLVCSSIWVTSQALEGKNDGLLGLGLALLALGLTRAVMASPGVFLPLVVVVGGLASTYSELVLVLVPGVALMVLLGGLDARSSLALVAARPPEGAGRPPEGAGRPPEGAGRPPEGAGRPTKAPGLLARMNVVAGAWALGAVLTPFAWIWLAESAAIGGRFSDGVTPFDEASGWGLVRVAAGVQLTSSGALGVATTALAVLVVGLVLVGLVSAVVLSPARGAVLGIVGMLGWLQWSAYADGAGNLQYRTAQFGAAFVLVLAVVGWHAVGSRGSLRSHLDQREKSTESHLDPRGDTSGSRWPVLLVVPALLLAGTGIASAVAYLPKERAELQHVPDAELAEAASWVRSVDPGDVSVVVPRFTDLIWLALELRQDEGVGYPVVPAVYLGSFPRWDGEPDRYYLVGAGVGLNDDVRVVHRNSRYALVEQVSSGVVLTPFQPTFGWARTTFMRGEPCARKSAQLLLLQGDARSSRFAVATPALPGGEPSLRLSIDRVENVERVGPPRTEDGWTYQTYRAPRFDYAIITLTLTGPAREAGRTAVPVVLGGESLSPADVAGRVDEEVAAFCAADVDEYLDGYDEDLTTLRRR